MAVAARPQVKKRTDRRPRMGGRLQEVGRTARQLSRRSSNRDGLPSHRPPYRAAFIARRSSLPFPFANVPMLTAAPVRWPAHERAAGKAGPQLSLSPPLAPVSMTPERKTRAVHDHLYVPVWAAVTR